MGTGKGYTIYLYRDCRVSSTSRQFCSENGSGASLVLYFRITKNFHRKISVKIIMDPPKKLLDDWAWVQIYRDGKKCETDIIETEKIPGYISGSFKMQSRKKYKSFVTSDGVVATAMIIDVRGTCYFCFFF